MRQRRVKRPLSPPQIGLRLSGLSRRNARIGKNRQIDAYPFDALAPIQQQRDCILKAAGLSPPSAQ